MTVLLSRLLTPACTAATACLLGLFMALSSGASPTWLLLCVLGGLTGVVIVWSGEIVNTLVYGLVFTAPIAITKSIWARGGVYTPGLEMSLVDVFLAALLLAWAVDVVLHRRQIHMPPPGVGVVLAIFAWAWVSGLSAEDQVAGVLAAVNQTKFLAEFLLLYNVVTTPRVLRRVLIAGGAGLAVNLLMVMAQTAAGSPLSVQGAKASTDVELVYASVEGMRAFRPSGFLLHPNAFADYLVIVLPVPIVLVLLGRRRVGPACWWLCLALAAGGTLALVLTLSRGGWISFAVATTFALIVGVRRGLIPVRHVVSLCGLAGVALAIVTLLYPAVIYRVTRSDNRSTESRFVMIDQAAVIIADNAVLGVGLGNYTRASHRYTPKSFAPLPEAYQDLIRSGVVHNGYLLLWAERGIIGLVLHLSVFVTALLRFRSIREWWDPPLHAVAVGLLAGVVGQGTFYLFDHFWLDLRPGVFWLLLGLVAAVLRIQDRHSRLLAADRRVPFGFSGRASQAEAVA